MLTVHKLAVSKCYLIMLSVLKLTQNFNLGFLESINMVLRQNVASHNVYVT
jgi:hypothetical protein